MLTQVGILVYTTQAIRDQFEGLLLGLVIGLPCSVSLLIMGIAFIRRKRFALASAALFFSLPPLAFGLWFLVILAA